MCDFIFMIFQGRKVLDGTLREIQDPHGRDRIRIEVEDGAPDLGDIAGVTGVRVDGARRDLSYDGGRDPQEILGDVLAHTRVRSYEIARPSLHEIFAPMCMLIRMGTTEGVPAWHPGSGSSACSSAPRCSCGPAGASSASGS
jgi:ABC-type uncharacterized transport system ATPase subunit